MYLVTSPYLQCRTTPQQWVTSQYSIHSTCFSTHAFAGCCVRFTGCFFGHSQPAPICPRATAAAFIICSPADAAGMRHTGGRCFGTVTSKAWWWNAHYLTLLLSLSSGSCCHQCFRDTQPARPHHALTALSSAAPTFETCVVTNMFSPNAPCWKLHVAAYAAACAAKASSHISAGAWCVALKLL